MKLIVKSVIAALLLGLLASPAKASPFLDAPIAITGVFTKDEVLKVSYTGTRNRIQAVTWFADGQIVSSPSKDLLLSEAEVGKTISAKVILIKNRMRKVVEINSGIEVFNEALTNTGSMTWDDVTVRTPACFPIRPTAPNGNRIGWSVYLSCQPHNTNFGSPTTQVFTWYRNNNVIELPSRSTYRLRPIDANQRISAHYVATFPNGAKMVGLESLAVNPKATSQVTNVAIVGTVGSGSLTAQVNGTKPNASFEYIWYRNFQLLEGANSSSISTTSADLNSIFHVLVNVTENGLETAGRLSAGKFGKNYLATNRFSVYQFPNISLQPITEFYVDFVASPSISNAKLSAQKTLIARAANYWQNQSENLDLKIVYFDIADAQWISDYLDAHLEWKAKVPGGVQSWINNYGCGFALTFKLATEIGILQCLPADNSNLVNQVGPHEYSHYVQFTASSTQSLYLPSMPWVIEGFANYFGLLIGLGTTSSNFNAINISLAGHATQFDISNGYTFEDFTNLNWFIEGSMPDVNLLFKRNGNTFDWYLIGTLVAEYLASYYGTEKLITWQQQIIANTDDYSATEYEMNKTAFSSIFGFSFDELALRMTPFLAERATQIKQAWMSDKKNQRKLAKSALL